MKNLKSILTLSFALCALTALVSGCVATADGHTQTGIWWKDSLVSQYPRSVEQVVESTRVVLKRNGKLLSDNSVDNTLKAKVNERTVYVRITKVDEKTTKFEIQVRTTLGSDISLASELDKQVALQLTVTP